MIYPRPFFYQLFALVSKYYDIWIWSASERSYILKILEHLDSKKEFVKKVLSRSECVEVGDGHFIKDPERFKNLCRNDYVMIDNLAISFCTVP